MMEEYQKKDISAPTPPKITVTAESRITNRYHFAGDAIYQAMSVVAINIEEATAIWEQKRIPLEPAQPEEKVGEEPKETNNE